MYSGFILIYGIEFTIDDMITIFNLDYDDGNDGYFYEESINEILRNNDFKYLKFIKKPCCYYERFSVFIAADLGSNSVQYRSNVEIFEDFQLYDDFFQTKLDNIKKNYIQNAEEINKEFNKFFNIFWSDGLVDSKLLFFTIPDDCESCT